ncbi:MAG: hypothetical protein M3462_09530 [Chloroflexota bacterium]|nr:hypothetical protein [Chloroflexota bacterium]
MIRQDGSTMVQVEHGDQTTIAVSDGVGGAERLRFPPDRPVHDQHLSRDGSRLVTVGTMSCDPSGCTAAEWTVFDTGDGHVISRVEGDTHGYGSDSLVDPEARRLYQLIPIRGDEAEGPWPVAIVAFDLTTGKEIQRLAVPGVRGGNWWTRSVDDVLVGDQITPAVALSPDGAHLAVVDAETDQLTMIAAATMTVEGTQQLARAESLGHRVLGWLGIMPQTAEAKVTAGRWLDATFAADGEHLYLWGTESELGDSVEDIEMNGLGVMLVHVESGEILVEALGGMMVQAVVPAPDDDTVYLRGMSTPRGGRFSGIEHLWRLDSQSLKTLAERDYRAYFEIAVLPLALPVAAP